ncbi:histidine kinase [uncultured Winogradskyella sp.]|uniref:tetratricopeptide repeat-containing sensor histidine kinase n=1 Tax=uncultured Winogradskyella sp. TaxID=395353 RepID=UPI00261042EB|nr:histidine kinase [uncultured Winogradskyella sp.]
MQKRTYTLLFVFITVFSFVQSQKAQLDSINRVLENIKVDSILHKTLYKIATKSYRYQNPEIHLYLIKKGLETVAQSNEKYKGVWLGEYGKYYQIKGNMDSSNNYLNKAIKIGKKLNDKKQEYASKSALVTNYESTADYVNAIKTYNEILEYENSLPEEKSEVNITKFNMVGLYLAIQDFDKAEELSLELFNNPKIKNDKTFLSEVCFMLAGVYLYKDDNIKALNYAKQAEELAENKYMKGMVYDVLGSIYTKAGKLKLSYSYYKKALPIFEEFGDKARISATQTNISNTLINLKDYNKAEELLLKIEQDLLKDKNAFALNIKGNYNALLKLYEKKGDYKKALYYSEKEKFLRDSLIGEERQKAIADFEVAYETEKKEREKNIAQQQLKISQLEIAKNKNLLYSTLIILGLLLTAGLFYYSKFKAKKKAELITLELNETQKRLALEKQYKDSELKALKAQMNPHFIFNALNSIQDYIVLNQKNLASDYLGKFADLIRNYLHFSDTGFISIPEEVHNLKLYLELEKLRFEEALTYNFSIDTNANSEAVKIPTMLIQPYVENALKHGLLHKKDNRALSITITKTSEKVIECVIEDNGIGREKSKAINTKRQQQHKSFALKATTERLDLLNYGKERKIGVAIIDLKDNDIAKGTKVILNIPILSR